MLLGFHDSLSFTSSSLPLDFLGGKKNTKRGKKPKPPSELSKTPKLCFSVTSLLENSREQKCCFRRSHYPVGSSNSSLGRRRNEEAWSGCSCTRTSIAPPKFGHQLTTQSWLSIHSIRELVLQHWKGNVPQKSLLPVRWKVMAPSASALRNYRPGTHPKHNEGRNSVHASFDPTAFNTRQGEKIPSALPSDVVTTTLVLHKK